MALTVLHVPCSLDSGGVTTPERRNGRISFKPLVGAALTFGNSCLAQRIDFENNDLAQRIDSWKPLPRLWRGRALHVFSSHIMYSSISLRESTPPQNRQLIVY